MNAMEHGNQYRADRPVTVRVLAGAGSVRVQITDLGGAPPAARGARCRTSRPSSPASSARAAGACS